MVEHTRSSSARTGIPPTPSYGRPVAVLGMHRSGTSLVARMLFDCGLYLGDDDDFLPPNADNTEGFWENTRFVELNDRVLATLGGSWAAPPRLEEGWERRAELEELYPEAQELLASFDPRRRWGWKDPRTSLTLQFWQKLVPELLAVLCVRHPREVVSSLAARGSTTSEAGLDLWAVYNRTALDALRGGAMVVTHYDSHFHDPEAELRRVLGETGIEASEDRIAKAAGRVNAFARHHDAHDGSAPLPAETEALYASLCASAGPIFEQAATGTASTTTDQDRPAARIAEPSAESCKYRDFDDTPGSAHRIAVGLVPTEARVLEFGCATGYMSRVLRDERGSSIVGIELDSAAAEEARAFCERVLVGDAEELDLDAELGDERFDAVLFGDVLEHLRDPAAVLRRVRPFVKSGGYVVASIPNIAHASVRLALLDGEFRYRAQGLLDDTHLRFFTRKTIEELFEASGYVVTDWHRRRLGLEESEIETGVVSEELRARLLSDPEATTYQFVVRAVPSAAAPRLIAMRALLDEARAELEELREARYKLERKQGELEEYKVEVAEVRLAYEALAKRLLVERAAMAEQVDELAQEKALEDASPLLEELRALRDTLEPLEVDNRTLRANANELETALHGLQNSRSIRYTEPLRRISGRLRRFRG